MPDIEEEGDFCLSLQFFHIGGTGSLEVFERTNNSSYKLLWSHEGNQYFWKNVRVPITVGPAQNITRVSDSTRHNTILN